MTLLIPILLLLLSIGMLWYGAHYLIDSAGKIAFTFGISELVIGLTVVAFGTSAPELAVTVNAALTAHPDISVGNIVGSNIFNLGFILGIVAIITTIKTSKKLVYRDGLFMFLSTLLLLFFFYDKELSRIEGIILFSLLIAYLIYLFVHKEQIEDEEIDKSHSSWKDFIIVPISIAVIVGGGNLLVSSASTIARFFGLSEWLIAVTIVAAGTSAPEMVTSIVAVSKNHHGMSAGNLVGSNIFNILGVLGVAGTIHPLNIPGAAYSSLILLSGMILFVLILMRVKWRINRIEGIILFLLALSMWIYDFLK